MTGIAGEAAVGASDDRVLLDHAQSACQFVALLAGCAGSVGLEGGALRLHIDAGALEEKLPAVAVDGLDALSFLHLVPSGAVEARSVVGVVEIASRAYLLTGICVLVQPVSLLASQKPVLHRAVSIKRNDVSTLAVGA